MKRRHHCKTSQAKVMLAVLALCGVTAFWGSVAWAADAGQAPVLVQDGTHYFSVNPENGNRDKITIMTVRLGRIPWPSELGPMRTEPWELRLWAMMP